MKFQKSFGIVPVILLALSLFSCKKDESASPSLNNQILKRWAIGENYFSSIEFTRGNQAIVVFGSSVLRADSIHSYFYKVLDSKTIDIINFGKMEISSINEIEMQFRFIPLSGIGESYTANKSVSEIGASFNNLLFCQTWKFQKIFVDGKSEIDFDSIGTVTFSFTESGTFLQKGDFFIADSVYYFRNRVAYGWWKWNPNAPGSQICTSGDGDNFDCEERSIIPIMSIKTNELVLGNKDFYIQLRPFLYTGRKAVVPTSRPITNLAENIILKTLNER